MRTELLPPSLSCRTFPLALRRRSSLPCSAWRSADVTSMRRTDRQASRANSELSGAVVVGHVHFLRFIGSPMRTCVEAFLGLLIAKHLGPAVSPTEVQLNSGGARSFYSGTRDACLAAPPPRTDLWRSSTCPPLRAHGNSCSPYGRWNIRPWSLIDVTYRC
ncbi:hypothetical protein L226DRAFT_218351 [Lentinus tigrinus ALCF2SS1-7]|uniref:Uncharacterized protein n=1 Tax=Lentinus tigrinus ALCF2SS1-6 TaxID=1328759 RepID=A0A5C2SBA7_9APHY|nr:hypothetical protein L227DRAFT_101521 [Lentinus tigrinus ALCF2SS1-6]RPD70940.1 hypothetical protein L226DRAFT_218351 [Lentinus tigrinus ALCF2SS1-7]